MWRVDVPTKIRKDLARRFPDNVRQAILDDLEREGIHAPGVRHLLGDPYRWKATGGPARNYRILFCADESYRMIRIQRIVRRTSVDYWRT